MRADDRIVDALRQSKVVSIQDKLLDHSWDCCRKTEAIISRTLRQPSGNFLSKYFSRAANYERTVTVFNSSVENRVKKRSPPDETPHQHTSYALCTLSVQHAASVGVFASASNTLGSVFFTMKVRKNLFGKNLRSGKTFLGNF